MVVCGRVVRRAVVLATAFGMWFRRYARNAPDAERRNREVARFHGLEVEESS
jgi:hypothetical protein